MPSNARDRSKMPAIMPPITQNAGISDSQMDLTKVKISALNFDRTCTVAVAKLLMCSFFPRPGRNLHVLGSCRAQPLLQRSKPSKAKVSGSILMAVLDTESDT
jgi:hypothetical protein